MFKMLFGAQRENRVQGWANVLLHMFFIASVFICLYPMLLVVGVSFTENDALREGYRLIPRVFSLQGYEYAISAGGSILRAYGITIFVTVVGTVGHVFICSLFAYPLSRTEFRTKKFFMGFVLIPMLFSGGMVPWYVVNMQVLKIGNTIWALILPALVNCWHILVLRTFFKTKVHPAIIEAARLDGCSEFRILLRIVFPLAKAGIATIAFFAAMGFWNDYWHSLMLITDPDLYSLQYLLYNIMARVQFLQSLTAIRHGITGTAVIPQESLRMAMCVLSVGPIILAYPFFQRFIVRGIAIGSIKG